MIVLIIVLQAVFMISSKLDSEISDRKVTKLLFRRFCLKLPDVNMRDSWINRRDFVNVTDSSLFVLLLM